MNPGVSSNCLSIFAAFRSLLRTSLPNLFSSPVGCKFINHRSLWTKYHPGRTTRAAWFSFLTPTSLPVGLPELSSLLTPHHPGLPLHPNCERRSTNMRSPRQHIKASVLSVATPTCRNALLASIVSREVLLPVLNLSRDTRIRVMTPSLLLLLSLECHSFAGSWDLLSLSAPVP